MGVLSAVTIYCACNLSLFLSFMCKYSNSIIVYCAVEQMVFVGQGFYDYIFIFYDGKVETTTIIFIRVLASSYI